MLVQDDSGKVTGVIAESDEKGTIQINAKDGVIVCTGGYGANDEMLQGSVPRQLQLVRTARQHHRGGRRHPHGAVGRRRARSPAVPA